MSCSSRTFCSSCLVLRRFEPILRRCSLVPLDAKRLIYSLDTGSLPLLKFLALTADVHTVLEGLVNRGVHFNQQVLFLSHILVAIDYRLVHPVAERITNDSVGNVAKPRPRNFIDVTLIWDEEWSSLVLVDLL